MVAPRSVAAALVKKRREDKSRNAKNINLNKADILVIGSSCQGLSPSLLVNSEGSSYLFNCGEGTQRNCYANRIKLTNLENLFVTRQHWPAVSGAYGLSLTLQDVGLPSFTIHSPGDISNFFKSTEYFMSFNTGMECSVIDCSDKHFDDSKLHVRYILLDGKVDQDDTTSRDNNAHAKKIKRSLTLAAFHCSLPDLPGTLDPQRCRELGVPIGPMLAKLKSGQNVELDNGKIVKSTDVCGPKNIGPNFIVMDCPTPGDIQLITQNQGLCNLQKLRAKNGERPVDLVIHFTPEEIAEDDRYRQWMDGFPDECKHILLVNSAFKRGNFVESYRLQYLLGQIEPELFPALYMPTDLSKVMATEIEENSKHEKIPEPDEDELKILTRGELRDQDRIIKASTFDCFNLRPNKICEHVDSRMSIDVLYRNAKFQIGYEEEYSRYKQATESLPSPANHEPEIVFLGTGSALPSKLRNTSCILVNFYEPQRVSIILDCGEDSFGQIVRHYGPQGAQEILKNLKMIYVSHHHADHHIGLIELLRQRKKERVDGLLQLLLPPGIDTHLNFYNDTFEDLSETYSITCTKDLRSKAPGTKSKLIPQNPITKGLCESLGGLLNDITTVNVEHCSNACAVAMDFNINRPGMKTFRLAYSGDARPSLDFAKIGEECDLLIHEATFDHKEIDAALEKKHSTTSEAIEQAKRMRAKFTILTHFSQKYPKIPYFTDEFDDTIGYAFDNMSVRCPSHLARLPKLKEMLKIVFAKSLNEIDARHLKTESKQKLLTRQFN